MSYCATCGAYGGHVSPRRRLCLNCIDKELEMWETGRKSKNVNTEDKATTEFLRLPFGDFPSPTMCSGDVQIVVQGRTHEPLTAHKLILASRSPVFSKMFDTDMLEKKTGIFQIDDAKVQVMHVVIKFCYTAQIEFTDKATCEEVLEVAHKYDIGLLRELCELYLISSLTNENLPRRIKLARKFECDALMTAATSHFKNNFDALFCSVLDELC